MDTLIATSRNIRHIVTDTDNGEVCESQIEAILTVISKEFAIVGNTLTTIDVPETLRFALTPASARHVAKSLNQWADEAEAESERLELRERAKGMNDE